MPISRLLLCEAGRGCNPAQRGCIRFTSLLPVNRNSSPMKNEIKNSRRAVQLQERTVKFLVALYVALRARATIGFESARPSASVAAAWLADQLVDATHTVEIINGRPLAEGPTNEPPTVSAGRVNVRVTFPKDDDLRAGLLQGYRQISDREYIVTLLDRPDLDPQIEAARVRELLNQQQS